MIKKPLIIPFLITLIFSTFSPIAIHTANAAITKTATASGVQYGGSGGSTTNRSCADTATVTGITRGNVINYSDLYIRYFTFTCTPLDAQGALSSPTSSVTVVANSSGTTVNCSSGYAATGMEIYGSVNSGVGFIGAVNLICQPYPGGGTAVTVGSDSSSGSYGSSTCAAGSFMTGVNARAGDGLDSIGASCSSFSGYPSITYSGNGSTSGTVPGVQSGSGTVTLSTNTGTLAKTGSYFNGWNTAVDGTGTAYAVGASYTLSASVTLYAKWVVITLATINNKLLILSLIHI